MIKTVLLTGGSGFIGKNIKESFCVNKYKLLTPTSKELDLTNDSSVDEYFKRYKMDVVIHCACKPGHRNAKDPDGVFFANTKMFFHLVKHLDKYDRLINIGSGSIYDSRNYAPKMKEDYFGVHVPQDELGFSKYVCGKYIENLGVNKVVDLRVFGVFGKYEDYAIRFISNAICKTIFDLPITVKQDRYFDYICVDDLIKILDRFIEHNFTYNSYNVTPDNSVPLCKIAEYVRKISGKDLPIVVGQKGFGMEYSGDNARLHSEIKDVKFSNIEHKIKELYDWYLYNKELLDKNLLLVDK
jgi:GDP-L-fucose synthase